MKTTILFLVIGLMTLQPIFASESSNELSNTDKDCKQELIELSKKKWQWMAEFNVDALDKLFHEKAVFVHMGATMNKEQELNVIRKREIIYKDADIKETVVNIVGATAVLLNRISLKAIVGGNEVINPFVVAEVYVKENGAWRLTAMSFTRQAHEYKLLNK